jgi:hypothetical protein
MNGFQSFGFGDATINNKIKIFFNEKSQLYDQTFMNIMICSNPETYTGVAYLARGLDNNIRMLIDDEAKQKKLQHEIYKSNETFFSENSNFFTTLMSNDSINTIDQINFCSFYKFQRLYQDGNPYNFNLGGMTNATIYACVNVDSNLQIQANQILEFLKVIIAYFKGLPSGAPVIETGIGGRIQRILFGGNFGCNLLHNSEICEQFTKNGMKIYTMPDNSNPFINNTNDSGNQMFIVDANVVTAASSSLMAIGGGINSNADTRLHSDSFHENKHKHLVRRLIIGEPIRNVKNENMKLIIINHKKKTKRRYR